MRQNSLAYAVAGVVIVGGLLCQWLLLSGGDPWALLGVFHHNYQSQLVNSLVGNAALNVRRPDFQTGIVFPRWGTTAYSENDTNWNVGLREIREQTQANWIQLTVNLFQPSATSTDVKASEATPSPEAIATGIRSAHERHYHVFMIPLLSVIGSERWSGDVRYHTTQQWHDWFESYWQAYRPYVVAASEAGAEEISIGTELSWMEHAPDRLWDLLIARIRTVFSGKITYDMNWTYKVDSLPVWMSNSGLDVIGVSAYYPLLLSQQNVPAEKIPVLWRENVGRYLDAIATHLRKSVLISEIGYRDTADTLLRPGQETSNAPVDEMAQARAFNAALQNSAKDPNIVGVFVWAWSVPVFQPNWRPAAQVIRYWYSALHA
ncbi:MAG TPA: hypothetical protein VKR06_31310 [Ktedonosporobacter sp.]|nr:hypothetical protein [Ktedonosporobacter sp.]